MSGDILVKLSKDNQLPGLEQGLEGWATKECFTTPGRKKAFLLQALEVPEHHFCHILLVKQTTKANPDLKKRDSQSLWPPLIYHTPPLSRRVCEAYSVIAVSRECSC